VLKLGAEKIGNGVESSQTIEPSYIIICRTLPHSCREQRRRLAKRRRGFGFLVSLFFNGS
jgi:hypothetical protein